MELAFLPKTKENVSWLRRNNINSLSLSTFSFLFLSIELNSTGPVRKAFRNRNLHVSDTRTFLCIYGLQLARGPPAESDVQPEEDPPQTRTIGPQFEHSSSISHQILHVYQTQYKLCKFL